MGGLCCPKTCVFVFSSEADEFFCWRSEGAVCVSASRQCDYALDCPLGEDEETCGEPPLKSTV